MKDMRFQEYDLRDLSLLLTLRSSIKIDHLVICNSQALFKPCHRSLV